MIFDQISIGAESRGLYRLITTFNTELTFGLILFIIIVRNTLIARRHAQSLNDNRVDG